MKHLQHLNKYFYKYRYRFLLGIIFVTISNIFAIYPAQIIREAFDEVAKHFEMMPGKGFGAKEFFLTGLMQDMTLTQKLIFFGAAILVLAMMKALFTFLMRQTIIVMSRFIEYDLKNEIYSQYQKLSMSFYKINNTGDLMNRISEDVTRVRMYLGPAVMYSIYTVILFILVISIMISVNPKLTLYVLLPLPVLSFTIYYVSSIINKKSEAVQRQLSKLSTHSQEAFSGIRVLKAYTRVESSVKEFERECDNYKIKSLELVRVNALFHPFMILLIGLSTLLTVYIGGVEAIAGNISTGNIAEFVIYVNMLTWPVASLGWVTSLVQRAAASQERINEFLNEKPDILSPLLKETPVHTSLSGGGEGQRKKGGGGMTNIEGAVEFLNVSFIYPDSGIKALDNITFKVNPGSSIAILGRTGSGKSTIAHLITRLYDVSGGEVLINNKNVNTIELDFLRNSIGYVPQDVFLFSDTIANNIAFGLNVSDDGQLTRIFQQRMGNEEVYRESDIKQKKSGAKLIEQVAKDAVIYDDIIKFPKRFNTYVGERGITLSGGQKQRVSIARAIIKNPKILVLDDCMSAVDTETEQEILSNLVKIMTGTTTIIISHRVSSVMNSNQIIVLDTGQIIERGDHDSLFAQEGVYYQMYQKQLLEEESY
ncbi:MAG: ABC transporter ATP-binding protein [Bacteroidota bacterium]